MSVCCSLVFANAFNKREGAILTRMSSIVSPPCLSICLFVGMPISLVPAAVCYLLRKRIEEANAFNKREGAIQRAAAQVRKP
jgi:hypothetical protein